MAQHDEDTEGWPWQIWKDLFLHIQWQILHRRWSKNRQGWLYMDHWSSRCKLSSKTLPVSCVSLSCSKRAILLICSNSLARQYLWIKNVIYPHTLICEPLQSASHLANGGCGSWHVCAWFALTWSWCRRCEVYVSVEVYVFPHEDIIYALWPMWQSFTVKEKKKTESLSLLHFWYKFMCCRTSSM